MAPPTRSAISRRLRAAALLVAATVVATACASATAATAPPTFADPTRTDADKYQVVFENNQVRVLRYHDEPGASTHLHHHPCFVLYALGGFERELTLADGTRRSRRFRAGETAFMPAQSHAGHNVGSTPTDALLVEFKAGCS
jgi:quercetin dioxygenase-like cupin family protein